MPDSRYQMVSGERRGRASRIAGKTDIPAKIYEMTDAEARMVRISENGHREDYHPMEEALNIGEMKQEFPTPELIATQLGKPPAYIRGRIKLLSLVPEAQEIFLADSIKIRMHRTWLLSRRMYKRTLLRPIFPIGKRERNFPT